METSKRSSQAPTIASVVAVLSLVQTGASRPSKGISEDEKISSREGRCESKLATAEEQRRGEIDSYLRDIRHRIEAYIENNRAYYEEAGRRWEACQNFYHQTQPPLDRLEQRARQATNQQIRLTRMYRKREEENSMYRVV
jgi:hypothetical protein